MDIFNGWKLAHTDNVLAVADHVSHLTMRTLLENNLEEVVQSTIHFYDMSHNSEGAFYSDLSSRCEEVFAETMDPFTLSIKDCWHLAEDKFEQGMMKNPSKGNLLMDFYSHPVRGGVYVILSGNDVAMDLFEEEYGERYYYWDKGTLPATIPADEWIYRKDAWRDVLGRLSPRQPLQYAVLRAEQALPTTSTLLNSSEPPRVPSVFSRIDSLMQSLLLKQYFGADPVNPEDPMFLDYYYSPASESIRELLYGKLSDTIKDISITKIITAIQ